MGMVFCWRGPTKWEADEGWHRCACNSLTTLVQFLLTPMYSEGVPIFQSAFVSADPPSAAPSFNQRQRAGLAASRMSVTLAFRACACLLSIILLLAQTSRFSQGARVKKK